MFPAYLWGIETGQRVDMVRKYSGSQPTYEELKLLFLQVFLQGLSVFPAYLWGIETLYNKESTAETSRFPAYLWGIETQWSPPGSPARRGSQPTYEELKPDRAMSKAHRRFRSQPTYEELKQDERAFYYMAELVPSLPMRNWNHTTSARPWSARPPFPAYLWGIETNIPLLSPLARRCSQPTYEELKPVNVNLADPFACGFPAYLWGIETRSERW